VLNYKGVIQERLPERIKDSNLKIIDDTYRVLIPTLSKSTYVEAKVISTSYSRVRYDKDDIVVVGQIDTTGDYIILGLVQKRKKIDFPDSIDEVSRGVKELFAILATNNFKAHNSSLIIGRQELSKKLLSTGWVLSSGIYYYELDMTGDSVTADSQIGIIPLLESSDIVAEASIYPYVKVERNKLTVYAKRAPLADIDVIVEVIN
jgi:hypothetical protein